MESTSVDAAMTLTTLDAKMAIAALPTPLPSWPWLIPPYTQPQSNLLLGFD